MKLQKIIIATLILSFPLILMSQDEIDLGGEDPIVRAVADSNATQLVASMAVWYPSVQRADSIRNAGPFMFHKKPCLVYPMQAVSDPGPIIAYENLSVFIYLEDLANTYDYLQKRAYQPAGSKTRRPTPVSPNARARARVTPPAGNARVRPPVANARVRRPEAVQANPAVRPRPNNNVIGTANATSIYPVVRQYKFYEKGLGKNSAYVALPTGARASDETYAEKVNDYQRILMTYQAGLVDPLSEGPCPPYANPKYIYEDALYDIEADLKEYELDFLSAIENEILRLQGPAFAQDKKKKGEKLTSAEVERITPALSRSKLSMTTQRQLAVFSQKLTDITLPLHKRYTKLQKLYLKNKRLLKPSEDQLFRYTLNQTKRLLLPAEALASYAEQVADAPNQETTYNQLLVITELIRVNKERGLSLNLAHTEGQKIMRQATQLQYQDLQAVNKAFKQRMKAAKKRK